jgi:hypothetical protein
MKIGALFYVFSSAIFGVSAALADTQIHAEYTAQYDRIRPDPYRGINLKHSFDVTLSGTSEVTESSKRQTGPMSDTHGNRSVLGQRSTDGNTVWRVAGPDRLERTVHGPQSILTMSIVQARCSLRFERRLQGIHVQADSKRPSGLFHPTGGIIDLLRYKITDEIGKWFERWARRCGSRLSTAMRNKLAYSQYRWPLN